MNSKILIVAILALTSLSTFAHSSVELRKQTAQWLGDDGDAAETPEVKVVVRNKTKNKCLRSVTGRIVLKNASGKVIKTQNVELLEMEIEGEDPIFKTPIIEERRKMQLVPGQSLEFHYVFEKPIPTWKEGNATIEVLKTTEVASETCGYFTKLTKAQQDSVKECKSVFLNQHWANLDPYYGYQQKHKDEAVQVLSKWCKEYATEKSSLTDAVTNATAEFRQLCPNAPRC